jgi:hypothetical protein
LTRLEVWTLDICVECYPDEVLVRALGFEDVIHEGPKSEVTLLTCKRDGVVGLEDEDPTSTHSRMLQRFQETRRERNIACLGWGDKVIVLICPRLEEWILAAARESGIDVRDKRYGLPDDPHRLHKVINKRLTKFRTLVEDLMENPRLVLLGQWLREASQ